MYGIIIYIRGLDKEILSKNISSIKFKISIIKIYNKI